MIVSNCEYVETKNMASKGFQLRMSADNFEVLFEEYYYLSQSYDQLEKKTFEICSANVNGYISCSQGAMSFSSKNLIFNSESIKYLSYRSFVKVFEFNTQNICIDNRN